MATLARTLPHRPSLYLASALAALAIAAIPLGALLAQPASAPFTVVESGRGYAHLQEAVDAIGERKGTIAIAPGRYAECAVQEKGDIGYLATDLGTAVFDGRTCEDKAA